MITYIQHIVYALDNDWIDIYNDEGDKVRYAVIGNARRILRMITLVPIHVELTLDENDNVTNIEFTFIGC